MSPAPLGEPLVVDSRACAASQRWETLETRLWKTQKALRCGQIVGFLLDL